MKRTPGETILSREHFDRALRAKRTVYVRRFFKGRPTSIVFVANMSYSLVCHLVRTRAIRIAEVIT